MIYVSFTNMTYYFAGAFVISIGISYLSFILIEAPIISLSTIY